MVSRLAVAYSIFLVTISVSNSPNTPAAPQTDNNDTLTYHTRAVVVTGTRAETPIDRAPVRVDVVSGALAQGTAISTVGELLREQPGLLIAPGSVRSGIQMMGQSADYTLILIDGQPLTGRVGGVIDLQRISVGNVERIEVVRGPLSSLYGGDALAGVINIITRRPDYGYHGRALARYIYHGASELQLEQSYAHEQLEVGVYGVARYSPSFDVLQDSARFPFAGFQDFTLSGRAWWKPVNRLKVTVSTRAFSSNLSGNLLQAQAGQITTVEGALTMLDWSLGSGIEWLSTLGRWTLQLYGTAYREGYTFPSINGDSATMNDSFQRRTGRAFLQWDRIVNARNRVMAGVEFLYDDAGGIRYQDNPSFHTIAAYTQWEGNPTESLSYALSLRADWTSAFGAPSSSLLGELPLLPRLSIRYMVTPTVALSATIGEGFKAPDIRQLFVRFSPASVGYQLLGARVLGLPLKPERALSFMFGTTLALDTNTIRNSLVQNGAFDVLVFFNRIGNMIEYFPYMQSPLVFSYRNVGSVLTYGIMFTLQGSVALDRNNSFAVNASYQRMWAFDERVVGAINRGTAIYQIPSTGETRYLRHSDYYGLWYRPFHSATLRLDYHWLPNFFSSNLRVQYVGSFGDLQLASNPDVYNGSEYLGQLLDSSTELVGGYWLINVGVERNLSLSHSMLVLSVGVNNALNVLLPRHVPTLIGRQFFISTQLKW